MALEYKEWNRFPTPLGVLTAKIFAFLDEDFDAFLDDDFLVFLALPLEDDLFLEALFEDDFLEDFDFLCDLNLFSI